MNQWRITLCVPLLLLMVVLPVQLSAQDNTNPEGTQDEETAETNGSSTNTGRQLIGTYDHVCAREAGKETPFCLFVGYMYMSVFAGRGDYISDAYIDSTGIVRVEENLSSFTAEMPTLTLTWECDKSLSILCIPVDSSILGITAGVSNGFNSDNAGRSGALALGITWGAILFGSKTDWRTVMFGLTIGGYWDNTIRRLPRDIRAGYQYPYADFDAGPSLNNGIQASLLNDFQLPLEKITGRYGFAAITMNVRIDFQSLLSTSENGDND